MSKEFAKSFFPSFTTLVSSPSISPIFLLNAWDNIFPDDVSTTLCGIPPRRSSTFVIPNRPCLALAALLGIYIGLILEGRRRKYVQQHFSDGKDRYPIRVFLLEQMNHSLSRSLQSFGSMNVIALIHHCVIPPPPSYRNITNSARRYIDSTLWALDCIFTGISSIYLIIIACMMYNLYIKQYDANMESLKRTIKQVQLFMLGYLSTIIIILSMLIQHAINEHVIDIWKVASTAIELIYLIPVQLAALSLLPLAIARLFNIHNNEESRAGACIALLGGILIVASLPLDASLCYCISTNAPIIKESTILYDAFHLPTLVFLGCDVSFFGLQMWINDLTQQYEQPDEKNKSKEQ